MTEAPPPYLEPGVSHPQAEFGILVCEEKGSFIKAIDDTTLDQKVVRAHLQPGHRQLELDYESSAGNRTVFLRGSLCRSIVVEAGKEYTIRLIASRKSAGFQLIDRETGADVTLPCLDRAPGPLSQYGGVGQLEGSDEFSRVLYDPSDKTLVLTRPDDSVATWKGVPPHLVLALLTSETPDRFLADKIDPGYKILEPMLVDGITYQPLDSKRFRGAHYDEASATLRILDHAGSVIVHEAVPKQIFEDFMTAPVKGSYYKGFIQSQYLPL